MQLLQCQQLPAVATSGWPTAVSAFCCRRRRLTVVLPSIGAEWLLCGWNLWWSETGMCEPVPVENFHCPSIVLSQATGQQIRHVRRTVMHFRKTI